MKKKIAKEKEQASEMRMKAMETLSQTNKRKQDPQDDDQPKDQKVKRRSNGSETIAFLREKSGREKEFKEKQLDVSSKMLEMELNKQSRNEQQHKEFMEMLLQNQQQQQQQQQFQQMQHFQMMMTQQQQQQSQLLAALLQKKD